MIEYDELKIYRGYDIPINSKIVVTQPTIDQIVDFGEKKYFNAIYTLCSVGADMKWQLWDMGQDYTQVEDYDLFIHFISQLVSSKKKLHSELIGNPQKYEKELAILSKADLDDMLINPLQLILNIDLADFEPMKEKLHEENEQIILYNREKDITIDRFVYAQIIEVVRKIHGFKRNNEIPANEQTKMDLIEDARDEALAHKNKPYKSVLKSLVSTLACKSSQCGDERIWNMHINQFFYDIKRICKIQDAELLLNGAYSGFGSLKGIDKTRLDMFGEI